MVVDRTPMNLLPIFSRFLKNLHNKVNRTFCTYTQQNGGRRSLINYQILSIRNNWRNSVLVVDFFGYFWKADKQLCIGSFTASGEYIWNVKCSGMLKIILSNTLKNKRFSIIRIFFNFYFLLYRQLLIWIIFGNNNFNLGIFNINHSTLQ